MQCSSSKYVIIVASGRGRRMGGEMPKQFLQIKGKSILLRTVENIHSFDKEYNIILVLNQDDIALWDKEKEKLTENIPLRIVYGGKERYDSVKNALDTIEDENATVAVHDGVRPFATKEMFERSFLMAEEKGSAVCAVKSTDSVRIEENGETKATDRNKVWLVQTPQTFRVSLLKKAYSQGYSPLLTDDASYVEASGEEIHLTEGTRENIKITLPADIRIAEAILGL